MFNLRQFFVVIQKKNNLNKVQIQNSNMKFYLQIS